MSDLHDVARLEDPDFYLGDPLAVYARMQVEEPVFHYKPLDTYVLTKHEDIRFASRNEPALFTSTKGVFFPGDARYQAGDNETLLDSFTPDGGEQIGTTDPPRHSELRKAISPAFVGRSLNRLEGKISGFCNDLLNKVEPAAELDWMGFGEELPLRLIASLIGVPEEDRAKLKHWGDEMEKLGGDLSLEEFRAAAREFSTMREYVLPFYEAKRINPQDDLLSALATTEVDNGRLSEANVMMLTMTVLAAGSETSVSALAGVLWALARHPEQYDVLRADPSLVPGAVEECLRWVTPPRGFMRAATRDVEVRGVTIPEGRHVYLLYAAANRDPDVFPDPHKFDIRRKESRLQLSFGFGTHVCIAAALVRFEASILLNCILERFSRIEVTGPAVPVRSVLRNGFTSLPITFFD